MNVLSFGLKNLVPFDGRKNAQKYYSLHVSLPCRVCYRYDATEHRSHHPIRVGDIQGRLREMNQRIDLHKARAHTIFTRTSE